MVKAKRFIDSKYFIGCILLVYIFIAYQSSGYHNPDEHYQIIEFANYKLGNTKLNELAWEYPAQIRSGLQPLLCFVLIKIFQFFGITSPYTLAFLLRAVTALASVFIVRFFIGCHKKHVQPENYIFFVVTSYLLHQTIYLTLIILDHQLLKSVTYFVHLNFNRNIT